MSTVALAAEEVLQRARTASVRVHRMVQGARAKAGAARVQLAQSNQELGMEAERQGFMALASQGGGNLVVPEWLRLDTIMNLRDYGISWQEVLQRLGFGPGFRVR